MEQTSRELVTRCLTFENPERVPRDMWTLPWAEIHYPAELAAIQKRFPGDLTDAPDVYQPSLVAKGDPCVIGSSIDDWGCVFENLQDGVIGEVKRPMVTDLSDTAHVAPPYERLPVDVAAARDKVNRFCGESDKFVLANCLPRPWERYQWLRGTEDSMVDIMMPEEGGADLLKKIHDYFMKELDFWVTTDVDGIFFMDDWGEQRQLLIPPGIWRDLFKPLYKEYCDIAHASDKLVLMHSDGNIQEIYPDLIEVGVNALNSQLCVMDMEELGKTAKGKIAFWGEIDRQHVLPSDDPQVGRDAVRKVVEYLYDGRGGVIAQFEFGPGTNPAVAKAILEEWCTI